MTLTRNLSLRIAFILLSGFVLLQLLMASVMTLPRGGRAERPLNMPHPVQARTLVEAVERTPSADRLALVEALNSGLFTLRLEEAFPILKDRGGAEVGAPYVRMLEGRRVEIGLGGRLLSRFAPRWMGPGRLTAPSRLAVGLRGGGALIFEGAPSPPMRAFLRQRAIAGMLGGLLVLIAIALAVRRSTRPLARLARRVRAIDTDVAQPDLPVEGPRETRDLALAFNEMKGRIAGLVAERTRILAAIAHDMRTYLTRLRLRAEYIDDPEQRQRAEADLAEMSDLLDDTLLFAKGASGAGESRIAVDVAAELKALVEVRREMGDLVSLDLAAVHARVMASPMALRRAFDNVIDNGLRYAGEVAVGVESQGSELVVSFADSGPGVSEEMLDRLAEPFRRGEPSRARTTGGAGLGLAIVEALITGQGARLAFANRPEGGFVVTMRFPRA
ncbi:cell wall metabolism sensor histidine kinase WalK [Sphingosinicella sp. CPCC 101087]|uniref:sensor histidine kinase n=1 Tax=Sphingosinicella sp. CPCC 101087 TaxID=2497754 RepID=UPI00101DD3D1|nr:ATP-binding protein [Sphingosinicella sp. CPCC 101087]